MKPDVNPFECCKYPVAGVDLSLASPAIVVVPATSEQSFLIPFTSCQAFFLTNKKKNAKTIGNIKGELFGAWQDDSERFETIAQQLTDFLVDKGVKHIALEDYSYGSHPHTLTKLAENCGMFKWFLHKNSITYDLYAPSSIKKCATGKGNADKKLMLKAFYEDNPNFDIQMKFGRKQNDPPINPVHDIVDAWYLGLSARVASAVQEMEIR